jgi:hypothetical protein
MSSSNVTPLPSSRRLLQGPATPYPYAGGRNHDRQTRSGKRTWRRVTRDLGGEPVITDGPFVEGKEVVSGYAEIEVADLDEALRMVRTWPGCPVVEIRPLE